MKACKFYKKGCCKYENNCKFNHVGKKALCNFYYEWGCCFGEHCENIHSLPSDFRVPKLCAIIYKLDRDNNRIYKLNDNKPVYETIEVLSKDGIVFYSNDVGLKCNMLSQTVNKSSNGYYCLISGVFINGCVRGREVYKEHKRMFEIYKLLLLMGVLPTELIELIKTYFRVESAIISFYPYWEIEL